MNNFFHKLSLIVKDSILRKRLLFVFFALVIFRLLANIPIPAAAGARLDEFLAGNQALGFFNVLSEIGRAHV